MELESEAMRQAAIETLGGITAKCEKGEFLALFDNEFVELAGEVPVEGRTPILTATSCDVERLELRKGSQVTVCAESYRIARLEPDGVGMHRVILRR